MSGTVLGHRLVLEYLAELDIALGALPSEQAGELREQISAHLEEALRPDADDQEVAAVLASLGAPADLAAESGAVSASNGEALAPRPARGIRVRARTWIAAGLAVLLLAACARYADLYLSAGQLQFSSGADWWYSQDVSHQVIANAGDTTQNTTLIRSGQLQGYVISIYNPTNVTQTILGDASGEPNVGWDGFGAHSQIAVSRSYADIGNGFVGQVSVRHVSFGLPVAIPPFQTRLVRVLWTSRICLQTGESTSISVLNLRVRVGWFTRTEVIPQQFWFLRGPSHGRCV